jgi:ADP-ribose pyrophosphatase YjhB (NUDIX family)
LLDKRRLSSFLDGTGASIDKAPDVIRPSTNAVVFDEHGAILLQKRADNGLWGLPGGGVEIGESVVQGTAREVLEETGLHVEVGRLIGVYSDPEQYAVMSYPNGDVVHYVTVMFECHRRSGELQLSDESTELGYFAPDELPDDTMLSHRLRIEDALANRAEPFVR